MRLCSRLIKIAAWTFLLLGASSGIATLVSPAGNTPQMDGGLFYSHLWLCFPIDLFYQLDRGPAFRNLAVSEKRKILGLQFINYGGYTFVMKGVRKCPK